MKKYKYKVIKTDGEKEYYFQISYHSKIIASGMGYNTIQNAKNGIRAICRAMGGDWNLIKQLIEVSK